MGVFQRIGNALSRFMYGRNGVDQLNLALLWAYILLWIPQTVLVLALRLEILDILFDLVRLAVVVFMFYRIFSRDLSRRRSENQRFLNWWWRRKSSFQGARARHADKTHKYFTCKNCKTICRVPAGKGNIVITCPKCGHQIKGHS